MQSYCQTRNTCNRIVDFHDGDPAEHPLIFFSLLQVVLICIVGEINASYPIVRVSTERNI